MWTCPQCGRSFARNGQDHYCRKPQDIDEYIAFQREEIRPVLESLRAAIRAAIPEAEEKISWSMPTYWKGRNLIQFAAFKHHIGLYPGPEAVEAFAPQLEGYESSKGTIRLSLERPLPLDIVAEIACWCLRRYGR